MQLRYNYRIDPQPRHRLGFGKAFGCTRVVFNDGRAARQEAYEAGRPYLTDADLSGRLTAAKTAPERTWLGEVSAVILDRDINAAVNVAKAAGLAVTACGAQVRPGPSVPAQRSETGTHPKPRREAA